MFWTSTPRSGCACLLPSAAPFDHVHWTEEFATLVETWSPVLHQRAGAERAELWIEGGATEYMLEGMRRYGFEVHTNAFLGLKVTFGDPERAEEGVAES